MKKDPPDDRLNIKVQYFVNKRSISSSAVKKLVRYVCNRFGLHNADISITLMPDEQIKELNARFLGRRKITDCLSFNLSDGADAFNKSGTFKSFEIVVNAALAERQAADRGHLVKAELALYIVHGLLHQLDFDDLKSGDARKMHKIEDEILKELGYTAVYKRL